jgi:hypothetical protein
LNIIKAARAQCKRKRYFLNENNESGGKMTEFIQYGIVEDPRLVVGGEQMRIQRMLLRRGSLDVAMSLIHGPVECVSGSDI